ncbi:hypothetical protein HDF16_002175 [Granulicella aggregans]|uniref:DdrB-like domain-containing protein n=1 Tax=Granulicella aggregans TaxID=474949 RepID=A0A7W8E3P9_9BACT|nr:hypothetical protein [Granulicella aggregans]MBB5057469.1 hypothetical protein [Granulicella aggregans]
MAGRIKSRKARRRAIARKRMTDGAAQTAIGPLAAPVFGRASRVVLNSGEHVAVRYAVMEADALITSHRGLLYERDPRYPSSAQPRDYKAEKTLQLAVQVRAQRLDPWQVLTDSVLPVDGPPIVRRDGVVLSGNGRTQSMRLAMREGLYGEVRSAIFERAGWFGFDGEAAKAFREPVLVRMTEKDVTDDGLLARYGVEMNRDPGQGMSAIEQSVGLARLMDAHTVARLASIAAETPDGCTAREFMKRQAGRIARVLVESGLIDQCKQSECFAETGDLTETAKDIVENVLAGIAVSDIDVLRKASLSTQDRLSRAGVEFLRIKSAGPTWDVSRFNLEAVRLKTEAENNSAILRGMRPRKGESNSLVEKLLHPERFYGAQSRFAGEAWKAHPASEALAMALELAPREYVALLSSFATRCESNESLFRNVHPAEVFSATIGRYRNGRGVLQWYIPLEAEDWS